MIIFKAVILSSGTKCERCGKAEVTCCRSADRNSKRHITCAAESGFQRGGVGAVGRKWLMCVCVCVWMVGGLAEEQAGFYCGPDFFCLFTHCLSGFGEKLLLLCPLRENQTKQNNNNNKKKHLQHSVWRQCSQQTWREWVSDQDHCTNIQFFFILKHILVPRNKLHQAAHSEATPAMGVYHPWKLWDV